MFYSPHKYFKVSPDVSEVQTPGLCATWLDEPQQTLLFRHLVLPRPRVVGGVSQLLHHRLRHSTWTDKRS